MIGRQRENKADYKPRRETSRETNAVNTWVLDF